MKVQRYGTLKAAMQSKYATEYTFDFYTGLPHIAALRYYRWELISTCCLELNPYDLWPPPQLIFIMCLFWILLNSTRSVCKWKQNLLPSTCKVYSCVPQGSLGMRPHAVLSCSQNNIQSCTLHMYSKVCRRIMLSCSQSTIHIYPAQLMRPGIGRNASCAVADFA